MKVRLRTNLRAKQHNEHGVQRRSAPALNVIPAQIQPEINAMQRGYPF
jgi:hypothetical protein